MISSDKSTEDCLAYQWWNSQISQIKNLNQSPEVVLPSEAHEIWSKICPIFLLFVIDEQDVRTYWESIQTIVKMFISDQVTVPNPISHFPEFIQILYTYQDILIPKNVDYCIYFIKKFGFHDAAHFLLYQSPVFFIEPVLYLETLLELRHMDHFLWNDFVKNSYLVDAFFEMYNSFLLPVTQESSNATYTHRILLCEVFYSLIHDSIDNHPNILSVINKFLDSAITLATSASNDTIFPVYRAIFSTYDLIDSRALLSKSDLNGRSMQLFESATNYLAFKFLYGKQYITPPQVLSVISHRGITSLADLTILSEIAGSCQPAPHITVVLRQAIASKVWHRACFSILRRLAARLWCGRQDARDFIVVVVRRLFVWVSLAAMRRRYGVRALLLCESLASLADTRVPWLQQAVLSAAVSIVSASKPAPVYFRSFFPSGGGAPVDDTLLHEWDTFSQSARLKTFPFDACSGALIMPPARESQAMQRALRGQGGGAPLLSIPQSGSGTFSASKKIKIRQADAKKAASSAIAMHSTLAVGEKASLRGQNAAPKAKQRNEISTSASFAASKNQNQLTAKKTTPPVQVVIKRPESVCRTSRSQSDIRFHAKRKDMFLP